MLCALQGGRESYSGAAVYEKHSVLFGRKTSLKSNKNIWDRIAKDVSSLSVTTWMVNQLKHRWQDTRAAVKAKLVQIERSKCQMGRGPACDVQLTQVEELVQGTLQKDYFVGIHTGETDMETEEGAGILSTDDRRGACH
ncbi:t-SNARE domain-containing protein 1-like [Rhinatrema bivittatum]|uniref:t-SNARE domain-containing protein 1-like n=1 Tax=Rhinatrema bivittatum TaxID=194408 RepID=UPI001128BAD3|nr:t-SNARE domain-containing protein 1-like [Rhinatrema bivittatum]